MLFTLFVTFFVPETKNKSIEEIKQMFRERYVFFDMKYFWTSLQFATTKFREINVWKKCRFLKKVFFEGIFFRLTFAFPIKFWMINVLGNTARAYS